MANLDPTTGMFLDPTTGQVLDPVAAAQLHLQMGQGMFNPEFAPMFPTYDTNNAWGGSNFETPEKAKKVKKNKKEKKMKKRDKKSKKDKKSRKRDRSSSSVEKIKI